MVSASVVVDIKWTFFQSWRWPRHRLGAGGDRDGGSGRTRDSSRDFHFPIGRVGPEPSESGKLQSR
ncbi:hypothetical protein [Lyngbya sp. CCY1209]|uniref:hypothetical protein n=1 Tax=Lyngbya sp. CCY1209 TaxID=2886103 RepID=UPI002D217EED|nr:hypothetical protein [Lyngbya sp. CCY1209]MEB3884444.1 hypothetical protein [Lyngbya sp. CCY1209]